MGVLQLQVQLDLLKLFCLCYQLHHKLKSNRAATSTVMLVPSVAPVIIAVADEAL